MLLFQGDEWVVNGGGGWDVGAVCESLAGWVGGADMTRICLFGGTGRVGGGG